MQPNEDLVLIESDTDEWTNEKALQNAFAILLEKQGYDVELEVSISVLGTPRRIDIMARNDNETVMIEAKQKLTSSSAYQACGQLSSYSPVVYADRHIVLVGAIKDDNATATVDQKGYVLVEYSPADDRYQRLGYEYEYDDVEDEYAYADYGYVDDDLDWIKWLGGAVVVLFVLGAMFSSETNTQQAAIQPNGIRNRYRVVVSTQSGNCQPLREAPNEGSRKIGCVLNGKELITTSPELQSGWVRVKGSANGEGWMFYHGLKEPQP